MALRNIGYVFNFVKIRGGQCCKDTDNPNQANDQSGLAMGQLVAHGVHHHLAFFEADGNQSVDWGGKGRHLGKRTDFTHCGCYVPPLHNASVELKGSENQGQNDVTNGQVGDEFVDDGVHIVGGFPDPDDQAVSYDG